MTHPIRKISEMRYKWPNGPHVDAMGTTRWFYNNNIHRVGAPAIVWADGDEIWMQYGNTHRTDGPALTIHGNANKYQWFLDSNGYDLDEWLRRNEHLSPEQKVMIKLEYG